MQLWRNGKLKPFHLERWDLAHRATDFAKWPGASDLYDIQYEHVGALSRDHRRSFRKPAPCSMARPLIFPDTRWKLLKPGWCSVIGF